MSSVILWLFATLLFILSIDGTMALRNVIAVFLLSLLVFVTIKSQESLRVIKQSKEFKLIIATLIIFVLYVLFHSIYLSHEPNWSLSEFKSHIFYPTLYFSMGIMLAAYVNKHKHLTKEILITILFFSIFLHILYLDLVAIDHLFRTGNMLSRYGGLMNSPTITNYLTNILLAMIISEFVYRLRVNKKILQVSNTALYLLLILSIFSTFVEAMRLGDIALVFLGIASSIVFLYNNHQYSKGVKRFIATSLIVVLTIPLAYNLNTDPRWLKLIETVPLAINTSNSQHWLDNRLPGPMTKSGYTVNSSNYQRIAWGVKSLEYIAEEPMGIGFGRNAFGHAMEMRHPKLAIRGAHAHSSILTLTVGTGVLGTFIWLTFVFFVCKVSIKEFKSTYNYFSLLVLFITMGFVGRSFVDGNMRDHVFLQFMLILGIGLFFLFQEKINASKQ
jgi:hypothetical protein